MGEVSMLSGRRWAKSGRANDEDFHDLLAHGLDVAAVLQVGLQSRPALVARIADALEMSTAATLAFLGAMAALHDVGKAAASFQFLDPALARRLGLRRGICADYDRNRNGHDRIGHAILDEIAREGGLFSPAIPRAQAEEIIGVFAYHHGAAKAPGGDDCYLSADRDYALSMVRLVKELFGWDGTAPDVARLRPMSYLINGALNLADWIGSDSRIAYVREVADPAGYLRRAREQAAELIRLIRPSLFTQPDVPEPLSFDELFPEFAGHGWTPSVLQSLCDAWIPAGFESDGPVLVVIEDLTGAGKTEASDLVAHRLVSAGLADGAFFGLPTMASSDKAFERRSSRLDRMAGAVTDKALLHSRAKDRLDLFKSTAFRDDVREGDAACLDWFMRDSKRGLLVPWSVGTIDQALFAALRTQHATIRQGGLFGKVLVVDEIHGLDSYMTGLLEGLMSRHAALGGSVVLMSATLTATARDRLVEAFCAGARYSFEVRLDPVAMPSLTMVSSVGVRQQDISRIAPPASRPVTLLRVPSEDDVVDRMVSWAEAGKSAVWFRNTVADARRGHERLVTALASRGLPAPVLYHSRFLPSDRARIEEIVTAKAGKDSGPEQRRSFILVSTQVAEQSLDLDFDEEATDLAPVDVLLQRFGRRGRHLRDARGNLLGPGRHDGRGFDPILVLSPDPHAPTDNWYKSLLWGAASVYSDEAELWATASVLFARGDERFVDVTAECKTLVEDVDALRSFENEALPEVMRRKAVATAAERHEDDRSARSRSLTFKDGFVADYVGRSLLDAEASFMTRLGDSWTVVVAFRDGDGIRLAADGTRDPIAGSEVRVPVRFSGISDKHAALGIASDTYLGRRLRFTEVVVLERDGSAWRGSAEDAERRKAVSLVYDETTGLRWS